MSKMYEDSIELTEEEQWTKRKDVLRDTSSFSTPLTISYKKLQELSLKEKIYVVKIHEDLFLDNIVFEVLQRASENYISLNLKEKVALSFMLLFLLPSFVLSLRNIKKFKNNNLELFI